MRLTVLDHPLVSHKLTVLRDRETSSPVFRQLVEELVTLIAYEATREVRVEPIEVRTPVSTTTGTALSTPRPLVVPILRAGLGMLEGMTRLVPTAEVGFLGMARNEQTLDIVTYAERLPDDLTGRQVYAHPLPAPARGSGHHLPVPSRGTRGACRHGAGAGRRRRPRGPRDRRRAPG